MEAHVQVYSYLFMTGPQTAPYFISDVCVCSIYSVMQIQEASSFTFCKAQTLNKLKWSGRKVLKHKLIYSST